MSRPSALRSRVAVFLCLALLASLVPQAISDPGTSRSTPARIRVAVGQCLDSTDQTVPGLADTLERSLRKSLADQEGVEIVSLSGGTPDRVISARIAALTAPRKGQPPQVQVVAESTDPTTSRTAYRTSVRAEGSARPGEDRVAQVHRAVERAAGQVAAQVAQAEGIRVLVISASGDTVTIDRGSGDGIVPGTELEIIRDGEVIARARVDRVREGTATAKLSDVKPGQEVAAGDQGRVTSVPETKPKPKKGKDNTLAIVAAVLIVGGIIAALAGGGGGGGGQARLTVAAADSQIPADGVSTTTITVTAKDRKGNPLPDGKMVKFRTTLGLVVPAQVPLASGQAQATLTSDTTPGTATVTVIIDGQRETVDVDFTGTGPTNVASIFLTRDQGEIPGDGISSATITAVVRDDQNNAVPDGTPVTFTTNLGMVTPGATTTQGGVASTTLRSEPTSTDTTAIVTAVSGPQQASITVTFTGAGGGGPTQINLIANRTNIPADGTSTAELLVTLVDPAGQPVVGETVTLNTTTGRLQVAGRGTWRTQVSATTNQQGVVEVLLRSTTRPNTATVTAAAPAVTSETASVTVSFTTLVITSVTANPASVPVGGNKSSRVTATIVDSTGNPAPDGTVVLFSIVNDTAIPGATIGSSSSTSGGQASAIFRSGPEVGTAQIRVEVPATGAVNDQTIIGITAGLPFMMTVAVSCSVASARVIGEQNVIDVTALVSDEYDNPVEDGTAVRFDVDPDYRAVITGTSTTVGGFATARMYATGHEGKVDIIASTTGKDGVRIDNTAEVYMGGAPVSCEIISPDPTSYSQASPLHLYTEADQTIVVRLKDSTGGPADPLAQVTFQVDRGRVAPDPAGITSPIAGTATAIFRSDQPTPPGGADRIIAVSEGVPSTIPLWIFIEVNPAT